MLSERLLSFSLVGAEWVLWLLIVLSLISLAVALDRLVFYIRTREDLVRLEPAFFEAITAGDLDRARAAVAGESLVRSVLRAGLDMLAAGRTEASQVEQAMLGAMVRERVRYEARLTVLGTIGNNVPFVGLFGTVLGIIQAFHQLGQMGAASGSANSFVMGAIGEALVATGVGILVAIPAVAVYNFSKTHVSGRVKAAEALMRELLSGLDRCTGTQKTPQA